MSIPDMPPVPRETPNATRPPRPRRRVWRVLAWFAGLLVFLVVAVLGTAVFALHSESGTRQLWGLATRLSAGMLAGQFDGGTVASGLRLHDVVYASGDTRVAIDRIDSRWKMTWSPMRLHVEWLRVGKIDVRLPASEPSPQPAQMPATLELPLAIDIDTLTLGELSLLQGLPATSSPLLLSELSGAVHSDGLRHRIVIDRLVTPYGKLQANGQIAGSKPFALTDRSITMR